jgi:antirestriction protein ArdC
MVTLLESGTNPWRKTWSTSTAQPPINYTTKFDFTTLQNRNPAETN